MEIKLKHVFINRAHDLNALLKDCNKLSTFCTRLEKQSLLYPDRYDPDKYKGDGFELFVEALIKLHPVDNRIGISNYRPGDENNDTGIDGYGVGINVNNIYNLQYNKEINLNTTVKFDIVIQNPPYNPNSLWKKFVEKGIELLNDNGQMVAIHPDSWRTSSTHNKFCEHLKEHISELHINDYEIWKEQKVAIKTDWYLYNKQKINSTIVTYSNGDSEFLNLKEHNKILRFSTTSIYASILNKITKPNYDNGLIMEKGFNKLYKPENHFVDGKYKQCGGSGNGTGWTKGEFIYTNEPSEYQFENKIIMSYAGKPRATFFSKEEQVGCLLANILLTDNINTDPKSICLLYNSKLFLKLYLEIIGTKPWIKNDDPSQIPAWILKSLNFENLNVQTEEELYKHYNLTKEEINWIEK